MFKRNYRKLTSTFSKKEPSSVTRKKEPKSVITMVPILSAKSLIAIAIGLILGVGLGLGYWVISPSLSSSGQPTADAEPDAGGLSEFIGMPHEGPYESVVNIQVVNQGSSYMTLKDLQYLGEYYAVKASTLPFFEFLSQELAEKAPQYSHTVYELDQILISRYDWKSDFPSIELKVTGSSEQEASFLAKFVPESFQNYLIAEAREAQQQEYQNTLKEIDFVKISILEAEQELSALAPEGTADDISNDPRYIALNAKIGALESKLAEQAEELSFMIASGSDGEDSNRVELEYQQTLIEAKNVNAALSQAKKELQNLKTAGAGNNNISSNPDYIIISAKIKALEIEIDRLMTGDAETTGLADMIARGITTGNTYTDTVEKIETASVALAEAREELAILENQQDGSISDIDLEYQLAQAEVDTLSMELSILQDKLTELARETILRDGQPDTQVAFERTSAALAEARKELATLENQFGSERLVENLESQVIQQRIDTLNMELAALTDKMGSLISENIDTEEIASFLVAGNPSIPLPVLPERVRARNALMMGAIVGIGGAWVALNFRWIAKGMPSSHTAKPSEDEEEEA